MEDQSPDSAAEGTPPSRSRIPDALVRTVPLVLLSVVLLGSLIYLLVVALGGADLVTVRLAGHSVPTVHHPRPWLIAALVAGVLALVGWARAESVIAGSAGDLKSAREAAESAQEKAAEARAAEARAQAAEADARAAAQQAGADETATQERLAESERQREAAEASREQMAEARRSEREWNRRLQEHVQRLQKTQGLLGRRHEDFRETVLRLTVELLDAEKGMLMSTHSSSDGTLEVVASMGFASDPTDSGLARRFAGEVMKRDTTIREDSPPDAEKRTPADEEVQNLLAIPIFLTDDFDGVIICANREGGFADCEDEVLLAVGDHAGAVLQNSRLHGDLRSAYLSTIAVLANAIELKDQGLRGHSDAVSQYVTAVAERMKFPAERRESLIFASLLHDIGKLGISERILLKPGLLTQEERAVIQLHPRIGYELVRQVPALRDIAPAILHHHERFDGDGYPSRLKGEAIPLEARIISIADTFSAITSQRPYNVPRSPEEALAELERCAGGQFDPEVVRLFCEEVRRSPPESSDVELTLPNAELELHRADGEFKLGGRSFAITDSLTLLYSHRHFHESTHAEAQRAALQSRPFAVIVVTLLDLEDINRDTGFGAGDDALRSLADLVQPLAAERRAIAFRASGRRIALLVPETDLATAQDIAGELHALLLRPDSGVGRAGIGTAVWSDGEEAEQVIARAREASDDAVPVGF